MGWYKSSRTPNARHDPVPFWFGSLDARPLDVSVVVAAWNAEKYLRAAIDSALSQAEVTVEVLVVDDASSDDSASVAERVGDPRVRVFRLPHNQGPSAARNHAIARAQGAWLAVLDADDTLLPGRLSRLMSLGERGGAAVVVDNLLIQRATGEDSAPMFNRPDTADEVRAVDAVQFIRGNRFMHGRYTLGYLKPLFRRQFVQQHGIRYDEAIRMGEDYLYLLEVLLCGGLCLYDGTPGYGYREHVESMTAQRLDQDRIRGVVEGDRRLLQRYPDLSPAVIRAQAARIRSLQDVQVYDAITQNLKRHDFASFCRHAVSRPTALRHLLPAALRRLRLAASRSRSDLS